MICIRYTCIKCNTNIIITYCGSCIIMRWLRVEVAAAKWETLRVYSACTHTHTPGRCRLVGRLVYSGIYGYISTLPIRQYVCLLQTCINWFPVWTRLISSGIIILLYWFSVTRSQLFFIFISARGVSGEILKYDDKPPPRMTALRLR